MALNCMYFVIGLLLFYFFIVISILTSSLGCVLLLPQKDALILRPYDDGVLVELERAMIKGNRKKCHG